MRRAQLIAKRPVKRQGWRGPQRVWKAPPKPNVMESIVVGGGGGGGGSYRRAS